VGVIGGLSHTSDATNAETINPEFSDIVCLMSDPSRRLWEKPVEREIQVIPVTKYRSTHCPLYTLFAVYPYKCFVFMSVLPGKCNLALDRIIKCDICADLIIFKRCRCTRIVIKKLPVCTIEQNFAVDKIDDGFTCYAATVAFFGNSVNYAQLAQGASCECNVP
jgi:hypothetical protein